MKKKNLSKCITINCQFCVFLNLFFEAISKPPTDKKRWNFIISSQEESNRRNLVTKKIFELAKLEKYKRKQYITITNGKCLFFFVDWSSVPNIILISGYQTLQNCSISWSPKTPRDSIKELTADSNPSQAPVIKN